ncbi:Sperm flagellar protein 2 [Myotis davidii]|uniref:Sperm flagellar protein 2 n=1 Tax=Myotis davidii TaxID=225400 RepID=L5M1Y5_MYODS|nr:Sperm flagellar protein 2 [Myotis davidii]
MCPDLGSSLQPRLFADPEKEPPLLDYTQMLLYFACHSNAEEGVYRALSVAVGTHIFQPIELVSLTTEKTYFFIDESPLQNYSEPEEAFLSAYRKFIEEKEEKEPEIPENINTEKISLETLLQVFRAQNKAQNANRFAHHLRAENAYLENFIKVFEDLGAKNLEPIEVSLLLKHPFIQDLISSYPGYKIPVSISQRHPHSAELRLERGGTFRCGLAGSREKLDSARQGLGKLSWEWHPAR